VFFVFYFWKVGVYHPAKTFRKTHTKTQVLIVQIRKVGVLTHKIFPENYNILVHKINFPEMIITFSGKYRKHKF